MSLAVVKTLVKGKDGLIQSANICTSSGRTSRPIARLYPLEVSTKQESQEPPSVQPTKLLQPENLHCSKRQTAVKGRERVTSWTSELSGRPEDVEN